MSYERLFSPRGVAIIGASQNPSKFGYGVARNLIVSNYQGMLYFVNPRKGRLFDREIYPDVAGVPDPVDLAMIVIPAMSVPAVLEGCGQRGIPYVIIASGGFKEIGHEGQELELKCSEIAQRYGIRVLGPNCIGFLDTHLPIDTTFLPLPGPIPGDIAFISHSGAVCEAVIDWARGQGFGLSRLVSLGNQMDLSETDMLIPMADDVHTRVITMYLEGVGDGRAFIEQAQKVSAKKPIVAIKVGRTVHGRDAVASHTGALAGQDEAFSAAFTRAGVIRAETSEELFDWARALAWCPLPRGRRMAILTNAGGPGAIAVDALDTQGLVPAELTSTTVDRLRLILPPAASLRNPVDMLASAGPIEYANCLRAVLVDEAVDGVMVILPPPPMTTAAEVAGAIIPVVRSTSKPVVIALMGEELIYHAAKLFRQARVPDYRFPERAASALAVLAKRAEQLSASPPVPEMLARIDREAVQTIFENQELKVHSPDLFHKTDVGGVVVDLENASQVSEAYSKMMKSIQDQYKSVKIEGALVQKMVQNGQEVIIGAVRDPQFGPLVMFGSGGVEVEGMKDVAFALAPLSRMEAESLLQKTWAGRRLSGFRNHPPADREAIIDAMLRVGQLAMDFPQIVEVEINPLRVFPGSSGALAVDVRLKIDGPMEEQTSDGSYRS
jgi:acetyl coenzyme A synthetase (ADP forming)-like protein